MNVICYSVYEVYELQLQQSLVEKGPLPVGQFHQSISLLLFDSSFPPSFREGFKLFQLRVITVTAG